MSPGEVVQPLGFGIEEEGWAKNKLVILPETNSKQKMHLKMVAFFIGISFFRDGLFSGAMLVRFREGSSVCFYFFVVLGG